MKRVPIQDAVAHMDAIWRRLSPAEMEALGQPPELHPAVEGDPESLI